MGLIARQIVEPSGTLLIRVQFWPDSTGIAREWLPFALFGTLQRYTVKTVAGTGGPFTFTITLADIYGADMLLDDATGTAGTLKYGDITAPIASRGQRPVVVGGPYRFAFVGTGGVQTPGVFDLHMTRDLAARFDHRGLTR